MRRLFAIILLALVSCAVMAQDNPAPLPPNYELVRKVTRRWCGEYRYKRLVKRFGRCDTSMTVDHFRCLYYGAALRDDSTYTLVVSDRRYRTLADSLGRWHPESQRAWWRLQMLLAAVWSSGDGTDAFPFHVASPRDGLYMRDDMEGAAVSVAPRR